MARLLRLKFAGAVYHVTARGNERREIYMDAHDRHVFVTKLSEVVEAHGLRIYAFALMANHYHLLLCTPRANLSRAMHDLQSSYTTWFNRRHDRSGHLYGGRYGARLVEGDRYLLKLTRYVHLNPVQGETWRSRPVTVRRKALRSYRWSTFPAYAGLCARLPWVDYGPLEELVSGDHERRTDAYRRYVEAGLGAPDSDLDEAMAWSRKAIGSEAYCLSVHETYRTASLAQGSREDVALRIEAETLAADQVINWVCARFGTEEKRLCARGNSPERDLVIKGLHELAGWSKRQVGHRLGHADGATVGKRLLALKRGGLWDAGFAEAWQALQQLRPIANCKA